MPHPNTGVPAGNRQTWSEQSAQSAAAASRAPGEQLGSTIAQTQSDVNPWIAAMACRRDRWSRLGHGGSLRQPRATGRPGASEALASSNCDGRQPKTSATAAGCRRGAGRRPSRLPLQRNDITSVTHCPYLALLLPAVLLGLSARADDLIALARSSELQAGRCRSGACRPTQCRPQRS